MGLSFHVNITEEQLLCKKINSSKYEPLNLTVVNDTLYYTPIYGGLYSINIQGGEPQLADDLQCKIEYDGDIYTLPANQALLFEDGKVYFNRTFEMQTRTGDIYDSFGCLYSKQMGSDDEPKELCDLLGIDKVYPYGDWLYFVGFEEKESISGMYRDFGDSFLCRVKKDGGGFEKLVKLPNYSRRNDIAIDDNYLYLLWADWSQPTDCGEPDSLDLYRMDKDGKNKTLLKTDWYNAFEPSSAPTSYFASNLTIHDGWIYAVLQERPFDGQIDTERYNLVRINVETGTMENPLPGGSYVLVRSNADFYAEPNESLESQGGSNGLSYYEYEFAEKTVNGRKWYKIFINEFGAFWMKSDGIVLLETAAQNRAKNGFMIKETSIDKLVAEHGMYQTFESSYCPANGDTEIRLIWPDFAIDLVANNTSFAGDRSGNYLDDGYNFGDKVNVLTEADKKLTMRTEAIYSTNKSLREGIEIGDHITSVEDVINMTYWSEDRPCMEIKNQYLEDSYLAGLPIKIQADKCFTAYNTETIPANYYVDYAEWTTYYFKGNELVAFVQECTPNLP